MGDFSRWKEEGKERKLTLELSQNKQRIRDSYE